LSVACSDGEPASTPVTIGSPETRPSAPEYRGDLPVAAAFVLLADNRLAIVNLQALVSEAWE
jgi:hypothetical protein